MIRNHGSIVIPIKSNLLFLNAYELLSSAQDYVSLYLTSDERSGIYLFGAIHVKVGNPRCLEANARAFMILCWSFAFFSDRE